MGSGLPSAGTNALVPVFGSTMPSKSRSTVVFPSPLGPTRAVICPGRASKSEASITVSPSS